MGCVQNLKGVQTGCTSSLGGLRTKIYVANKSDIKTITLDAQGETIETIEMQQSKYFVPFEFRKQSSGLSSNWTIDDVAGVKFCQSELTLRFAKQDSVKRVEMQALMLGEFCVLVEDQNGMVHFLGYDNPVTATAGGANTGVASTDANEYTITLSDTSTEYPYEYAGDISTLLAPTV